MFFKAIDQYVFRWFYDLITAFTSSYFICYKKTGTSMYYFDVSPITPLVDCMPNSVWSHTTRRSLATNRTCTFFTEESQFLSTSLLKIGIS